MSYKKPNNRIRLIKRNSDSGSIYHCVSRTMNKEFLWGDKAKAVLRKQIWKVAAFCGVDILSYCLMSNHFHILVRVVTGRSASLSDEEILERLNNLYTNPEDTLILAELQANLFSEEKWKRDATRKMLLARMDDLSNFMKILKQRFSIWYNRNHNRLGTHWNDRFRSVLIQDSQLALKVVAAYIALNPVRAGICKDPKDYHYHSYTEALAGNEEALQGLLVITGESHRQSALEKFRQLIHAIGVTPKADGAGAVLEQKTARKVLKEGGKLPLATVLYCKARHFTHGVAIGSAEYLEGLLKCGNVKPTRRTRMRPIADPMLQTFRG